jgi:hypothetical protein
MPVSSKLFRAIVVMGASLTAGGCDDDTRCHHCSPPADANQQVADGKLVDAGTDAPKGPRDAEVDTVLIL